MDEAENIIELLNEENEPERFEHLMSLSYKEKPYLVMHPVGSDDVDEGEVVIFAVEAEDDGSETYNIVDDPELAQEVFDEFLLILDADEEDDHD